MSVRKEAVKEAGSGSRFNGGSDRAGMFASIDAFSLIVPNNNAWEIQASRRESQWVCIGE